MCGICGIYNIKGVSPENLHSMAKVLEHRGPDDEGYYLNSRIGLGHRRLSIIDINTGKQPICNEDGTIWIVFNGEIYNFKSIREGLIKSGHKLRTKTDTEVIVHLYEEMGEKCLEKLNGMFAFAIWDSKSEKLFLARDRIGQKPLFYSNTGDFFLFASEVKSILKVFPGIKELDYNAIHQYLSLRFIPPPHTMFKNVNKLPAAHYLVYRNNSVKIHKYWDVSFEKKLEISENDLLESLDIKLHNVIEAHLVSDVPVGAFLSGGMDTSTVVAYMGEILNAPFKTFSIGVEEQDFNELPYAKIVSEKYNTIHIERMVYADIINLIPKMIWHLDEPSDPIAACMFHAAKLASENLKVVLGGDGGDELFAGFDRYMGVGFIDYYNWLPEIIKNNISGPIINSLSDSFTYKSLPQKLRWMHQLSNYEEGERYAEATSFFRFNHKQKKELFNIEIWKELKDIYANKIIVDQYNAAPANNPLDRMLYADIKTRLAEHTLMLTDRMNMAFSLEARSPFLDHELVEYLAAFPAEMKIKGRNLKYILRKLAERYLPKEITKRKKQGFMFPVAYWFRNELYDWVLNFLKNSHFVSGGLFNEDYILRLVYEHRENLVDNHVRIWMLLNLEIWYQVFIENVSPEEVQMKLFEETKLVGN